MSNKIPIDGLAILAHKCAPNIFDLSTRMLEYSIRDQILRSALFAQALAKSAAVGKGKKVLVIGAGVAGCTAASVLAASGCSVDVIEKAVEPFTRFRENTKRYVGMYMYEWPNSFYADQAFPKQGDWAMAEFDPAIIDALPSLTTSEPVVPYELSKQLDSWLCRRISASSGKLAIWTEVAGGKALKDLVLAIRAKRPGVEMVSMSCVWETEATKKLSLRSDDYSYVVLAPGAPAEKNKLTYGAGKKVSDIKIDDSKPFWDNDTLVQDIKDGLSVAIIGGGDGACQDFIRATLRYEHALEAIKDLGRLHPEILTLVEGVILTGDISGKRLNQWGYQKAGASVAEASVRKAIDLIMKDSMLQAKAKGWVLDNVRNNGSSVTLFRRAQAGRCYALNRFLMELVMAFKDSVNAMSEKKLKVDIVTYENFSGVRVESSGTSNTYTLEVSGSGERVFHKVVVRIGLEDGLPPAEQTLSVTGKDRKSRASLTNLLVPYSVPGFEPILLGSLKGSTAV